MRECSPVAWMFRQKENNLKELPKEASEIFFRVSDPNHHISLGVGTTVKTSGPHELLAPYDFAHFC